jgi:hypothetical protein
VKKAVTPKLKKNSTLCVGYVSENDIIYITDFIITDYLVIYIRGAQIRGSRSPWQFLVYAGLKYQRVGNMEVYVILLKPKIRRWHLDFWKSFSP